MGLLSISSCGHRVPPPAVNKDSTREPQNLFFFFNVCKANHTHISPITPMLLALDSPHTPRPWWPQLGSSDPEKYTPSSSCMNSPVCRDSRRPRCWECGDQSFPLLSPPPPSEWQANYVTPYKPAKLSRGRGRIRNPIPQCVGEPAP